MLKQLVTYEEVSLSPLLQGLTEEQVSSFVSAGVVETYGDGQTIIEEGEEGNALYLILSGCVLISSPPDPEIAKLTPDDGLVSQYEGDFFGEMALLDLEPRSASVVSVGKTRLLKFTREAIQTLFAADDNLRFLLLINIARTMSRRLRATNLRKKTYVRAHHENVSALEVSEKIQDILIQRTIQLATLNERLEHEIRERKKAEAKIKELAIHDGLTRLLNQAEFYRRFHDELERCKRYGNPFSLLMGDLDNFKQINDTYGHRVGDKVLRVVSEVFRERVRAVDQVARYGGEEFAILMPGITKEQALQAAERLRRTIEQTKITTAEGKLVKVEISFGVAAYPADGTEQDTLFKAADQALYEAKRLGRNRVVG